jgi:hypothetical protein
LNIYIFIYIIDASVAQSLDYLMQWMRVFDYQTPIVELMNHGKESTVQYPVQSTSAQCQRCGGDVAEPTMVPADTPIGATAMSAKIDPSPTSIETYPISTKEESSYRHRQIDRVDIDIDRVDIDIRQSR